jgi:hypothetical protein
MAYGLQFTNNSNVVTLDSEYARLCVLCSGRYAPTEESGLVSTTSFPFTITSAEPPLIFVRPDTTSIISGLCFARVIGSPGAWTGFYVRAYDANTARPNGRYFAAAFMASRSAAWGMDLWDGAGKLLFDSGTPSALFTRAYQNWTFVKSQPTGGAGYVNYYTVSFNFPANEYMMINNFGMSMVSGSVDGRLLASWWDFPGNTLWAVTTATSNPTAFYLPALFAKMNN